MMTAPQELLKEYVKSQHFTSTAEIMRAMKEMFRDVVQTAMEVELDEELGRERCQGAEASETVPNYRNGYSHKTVKTQLGEVEIKVPRDRNGSYEPKLIGKYSRNADGMEEKILALYACGISQRDIAEQIKELYDVEISPELVTKITEKIMPEVTAWQNRPLEKVYPFIFMDAIHYKVKEDHRYVTKAAYVVLGITMDGRKEGHSGRVDWGAREQQIWAFCAERPQKQGSFGCLPVLHRRSVRHDGGYSGRISPEPFAALHRPSDTLLHPLRQLEGHQAGGG